MTPAEEAIRAAIARSGSIRVDEFVDHALYHPEGGFFSSGGGAGRAGADFLTSPEVGPLFGAVVARWLDARWEELGSPDPFVVVEAAAGRGALALAVLAAVPACAAALRYVMVERSAALRDRAAAHLDLVHPFEVLAPAGEDGAPGPGAATGPLVCSLQELPATRLTGVVVANELLDNLPFRLFERTPGDPGWSEVVVTTADGGEGTADGGEGTADGGEGTADGGGRTAVGPLVELAVPARAEDAARLSDLAPDAARGARVPLQDPAARWVASAVEVVERGSLLVLDYGCTTADLAARPVSEWLRTYRHHARGGDLLRDPGTQDITCEVALDQLAAVRTPDLSTTQAAWLAEHGIEELVAEGRRTWSERAAVADLDALRARSRVGEAEALCDPRGLGAFRVLEWRR